MSENIPWLPSNDAALRLHRIVERFEDSWRSGGQPAIDDYLGDKTVDRRALLIELVHTDLEHCLKARQPVRVEEYWRRYPELVAEDTTALDLIATEYVARRDFEPGLDWTDYLERFPRFRAVLPARLGQRAAAVDRPLLPGFEVLGLLGTGGMGVVYKARQVNLNRIVALKMLTPAGPDNQEAHARFLREARAAARLKHPNIVPVHEVGEHEGRPFCVLEYVADGSLADRLVGRPQPPREAGRLVEVLAGAIHYAHGQGVIHRDLKPANILLQKDEGGRIRKDEGGRMKDELRPDSFILHPSSFILPKITDFGLAKQMEGDARQTRSGVILGTPSYMAPEQAAGHGNTTGPATDVFGLGAVLYELLTGRPPFQGETVLDTLWQVRTQEPVPPRRLQPKVPLDLNTICLKCLQKEPRRRYASALELAEDLQRFLKGEPIKARPVGPAERLWRWSLRSPRMAASIAVVGLLLVVVGGLVGYLGYGNWQRSVQTAGRIRDAQQGLDKALLLRDQGDVAKAQVEARRAEALLPDHPSAGDLHGELQRVLADLELREATDRLLGEVDDLRLERAQDLRPEVTLNEVSLSNPSRPGMTGQAAVLEAPYRVRHVVGARRTDRAYGQAFKDYGIDADVLGPEEAAAKLRDRPRAAELAAAVFSWAMARKLGRPDDSAGWQKLMEVAQTADPDDFRKQVRDAVARLDRNAATQLAGAALDKAVPATTLVLLADALDGKDAEEFLREAQQRHPGDFWINHQLGIALLSATPPQPADAARFFAIPLSQRSDQPFLCLNLGAALLQKGGPRDLDEAIALFRKATQLLPSYAKAHYDLGVAYHRRGQVKEALEAFQEAIRLEPDYANAHHNAGMVFLGRQAWDEAISCLQKALQFREEAPDTHYALARAFHRTGDLDKAIASYERALHFRLSFPAARFALGMIREGQRNWKGARAEYEEAAKLDPKAAGILQALGTARARTGDLDGAVKAFEQVVQLEPQNAQGHYNLGRALDMKEDRPGAIAAYRKALERRPDLPEALFELGQLLMDAEALEEAERCLRQYLKQQPQEAYAQCMLGLTLQKLGKFEPALALLKRGHALGSKDNRWDQPSGQWVKECEAWIKLEAELPAILRGEAPASLDDRVALGEVCTAKCLYGAAARFFEEAFTARPELAKSSQYVAARAAAKAACGQGKDDPPLDEKAQAHWRKQAQVWLRADLASRSEELKADTPEARASVSEQLQRWRLDPSWAVFRDAAALSHIPRAEREAWLKLWTEVDALFTAIRGRSK